MPKGALERSDVRTSAAEFRDMLHRLEIDAAAIRGRRLDVIDVLKQRDAVEDEYHRLQATGMDLRAEATRIESIDNRLQRSADLMNKEMRAIGGLAGARQQQDPPEERWWWYVDEGLQEQRRKSAIRFVAITVSVLVVLLAANYLLDKFYGLSPIQKQARAYAASGDEMLAQGDVAQAIAEYENAAASVPDDGTIVTMLAVLYELGGRDADAEQTLQRAQELFVSKADYFISLGQSYQSVREIDKALEAANAAVEAAPDNAQALLLRGGIYESENAVNEALIDFENAATMAQSQQKDTLYVLAKMRYGMLLERAPSMRALEEDN